MAGAPEGNKNAVRGRQATRALELALAIFDGDNKLDNIVEGNGTKALVKLWLKQIEEAAAEGDTNKMKLITERLDGRPAQSLDIGGQEDNPINIKLAAREMTQEEAASQYNDFMKGR